MRHMPSVTRREWGTTSVRGMGILIYSRTSRANKALSQLSKTRLERVFLNADLRAHCFVLNSCLLPYAAAGMTQDMIPRFGVSMPQGPDGGESNK